MFRTKVNESMKKSNLLSNSERKEGGSEPNGWENMRFKNVLCVEGQRVADDAFNFGGLILEMYRQKQ